MPARHEPAPVVSGRLLGGRYRLGRLIARGGMAEVWEGHDEVLTRAVAVKILHPHLAGDGLFLERFRSEAVSAAGLAHPGVVSTFDTGVDDGTAYIVMELVKGRTLRQFIRDGGAVPPAVAVNLARQIADVLAHAHRAGLVHRDVKPANVLLLEDGWSAARVKVTDFGIAKAGAGLGLGDLTRTGTVLGTPKYLAPEQIRGEEPDPRSDLYSLGVVLYEMLAGEPPFQADTDMATALAHLNQPVPKLPSHAHVPPPLEALVGDLLAKDPTRRVPSADALLGRLDALGDLRDAAAGGTNGDGAGQATSTGTRLAVGDQRPNGSPVAGVTVPAASGHPGPKVPGPRRRSSFWRSVRTPTAVVVVLAVIATVAAEVALNSGGRHRGNGVGTGPPVVRIADVAVWMVDDRPPDNPSWTRYTFDGNPSTYWETDHYANATFGNLYPGMGLEIHLSAAAPLHELQVTSPTVGWSASTYVSSAPVANDQAVGVWGSPTDQRSGIDGDVTFNLDGRKGPWVLLWLTNLGPGDQIKVDELAVR